MIDKKLFYKLPVVGWIVTSHRDSGRTMYETTPLLSTSGTQGDDEFCQSEAPEGKVETFLPAQPGTFLVLFRPEHDPYRNPYCDDVMPTELGLQHPCDQLNDAYWQKAAAEIIQNVTDGHLEPDETQT